MKRLLTLLLLLLSVFQISKSRTISETYETSDTLEVFFHQDKIRLESDYRNNGERIKTLTKLFQGYKQDSLKKIRSILIVSGASPEGPTDRNRYLSDNRAKVIYDYLIDNRLVSASDIEIESRGVDWIGLTENVKKSDLPYKEEVLAILKMPEWITQNGKIADGRKHRLMNLYGGSVWRELYDLYFADLRHTKIMIAYDIKKYHSGSDTIDSGSLEYPEKLTVCTCVTPPF